jgi:hypothetical protein
MKYTTKGNKASQKRSSEREFIIKSLKDSLLENDTIYTKVISVSKTGMSRAITFMIIRNNRIVDISDLIAKAKISGARLNKYNDCVISGCGLDVGYYAVEYLSQEVEIKLKQEWI